jgi:hypothetical protein
MKKTNKRTMEIENITIKQIKDLLSLISGKATDAQASLNGMIGNKVIIRTYSAGNWFGVLTEKSGDEVILSNARRMWRWWAAEGISLSCCALHGVKQAKSKIVAPVDRVWLTAIEIIPCTVKAITSIEGCPHAEAE